MAKTDTTQTKPVAVVSAKIRKLVLDIKRPFMLYVDKFAVIQQNRAELAPKFMRAASLWSAETGGRFTDFVRMIDPSVPAHRGSAAEPNGYRDHKTFQAADYLRRLAGVGGRKDVTGNRAKPIRSKTGDMARLLATVLAFTSEPDRLWAGVAAEFSMTTRQITKLKQVVAASQPLIRIPTNVKPVRVHLIHAEAVDPSALRQAAA